MFKIESDTRRLKHDVLTRVAELAYQGKLNSETIDEIPFEIIPGRQPHFRCCVYKEREIIHQRVRLAMGKMPNGMQPTTAAVTVIPAACEGCPIQRYTVTENCQKCLAKKCMAACPFGAIADKSQIYQLIQAIKKGDRVVAAVAPAIIGQFGPKVTPGKTKTALLKLGFKEIYEVAYGADMGCITEAHHYVNSVATGKLPFLFTSCCPAWVELTRRQFPDLVGEISQELTPMVATARHIKEKDPEARVVFIGPCAAKKLEASRTYVRSYVDFVITFEELVGMFDALDINPEELEESPITFTATGAGRGYAVSGGVASAIEKCIDEYYPGTEVKIQHAEGLAECKKMLTLCKAGKLNGYMIEGMGCPGGCVAGVGTIIPVERAKATVEMMVKQSARAVPDKELEEEGERLTRMSPPKQPE